MIQLISNNIHKFTWTAEEQVLIIVLTVIKDPLIKYCIVAFWVSLIYVIAIFELQIEIQMTVRKQLISINPLHCEWNKFSIRRSFDIVMQNARHYIHFQIIRIILEFKLLLVSSSLVGWLTFVEIVTKEI